MSSPEIRSQHKPSALRSARDWWAHAARVEGPVRATRRLLRILWDYTRDSTPDRLRARFGDAEYDWDHRVNTTSGAVGWRDRLLGMFHSAYQPTDPAAFAEMMAALRDQPGFDFREFDFIDLGSGKGRTLLMASDYPFHRIVGVELLPSLHAIAEENISKYKNDAKKCFALASICADAITFPFPADPLVLYLFNPFPESGMRQVLRNLDESLRAYSRQVYVLYHNPLEERAFEGSSLKKIGESGQFSLWSNAESSLR